MINGRLLSCASLLICISFVFSPKEAGSQQAGPVTFSAQSNLVMIPTIVHDKSGAHVSKLNKEDFTLSVDGRTQPIAVFEEVRPGDERMRRATTAPDEFTNMLSGQMQPTRLTVIALDTVMTPELRQTKARMELLKVLAKTIRSDSSVALVLVTTTGTRVIHDFTTDPAILVTALNKVVSGDRMARDTQSLADQTPSLNIPSGGQGAGASSSAGGKAQLMELNQYFLGEFERSTQELERRIAISKQMDALEQIARALSGLPGRKSLIWVAGGFPFTVNGSPVGVGLPGDTPVKGGYISTNPQLPRNDPTTQFRTVLPTYERVWKAMNDANMAIYAIDTRGLTTEGNQASVRLPNPNEEIRQHSMKLDTQSTFEVFAEVTGGRAYTNTNDFQKAYQESMDDAAAYYLIGYYVNPKSDKEGWHDLGVKVNRPGVEVRSRRGFILRKSQDKATSQSELENAMKAPLDYTGVPIMGRFVPSGSKGAKRKVTVSMLLPAGVATVDAAEGNHLHLSYFVRVQAPDGSTVAHSAEEQEGRLPAEVAANVTREGVRYEHEFELAPGEYSVHIVVRDDLGGRTGSIATTLKVADGDGEAK